MFSEDKQKSFWIKDDQSRKGTFICIGSESKPVETFPLVPGVGMCIKIAGSNFYVYEAPDDDLDVRFFNTPNDM